MVIDKRHEVYNSNSKTPIFQGHGNRLGSTNEGKPTSHVLLEPVRKIKNHDSHTSFSLDLSERNLLKKHHKKRPRNLFIQDDRYAMSLQSDFCQRCLLETPEKDSPGTRGQKLNLKIRFGGEKTESFVLEVPEDEKMLSFQIALQQKLCERFHDQCLVSNGANNKSTDFEIHIYGKNPFRLSEHLNQYPAECGIVNNSVINVTEI